VYIVENWMKNYKHFSDDLQYGLIGAVKKGEYDFLSVFQISKKLGAEMIMLDEGGSYVGIRLDDFFRANDMNPDHVELFLQREDFEQMNKDEPVKIRFPSISAIPLTSR